MSVGAGSIVWEREQDGAANTWSGVLSTATGLVFFGDDNGDFAAVGGQQFIAVAAGGSIFAFGL
jgi:hypothetical protein